MTLSSQRAFGRKYIMPQSEFVIGDKFYVQYDKQFSDRQERLAASIPRLSFKAGHLGALETMHLMKHQIKSGGL